MTDDSQERTRGIHTSLDLSEVINIPNITSEMESNICTNVKEIEAKAVNERKISIKATIEYVKGPCKLTKVCIFSPF